MKIYFYKHFYSDQRILIFVAALLLSMVNYAETVELTVNGKTIPVTYRKNVEIPNVDEVATSAIKSKTFSSPTVPTVSSLQLFPLLTPMLTLGMVPPRQTHYPQLIEPFFIIGTDLLSQRWLEDYHIQLKKIHAEGFIVNVNSEQELDAVYANANDLTLMPINGAVLAKQFNLVHYPVLVSKTGIEQ